MAIMWSFNGFDPDSEVRSQAKSLLWKIKRKSPSDSRSYAFITKSGDIFEGCITLSSKSGVFKALASGSKVEDVLDSVCLDIRNQIACWKKERTLAS